MHARVTSIQITEHGNATHVEINASEKTDVRFAIDPKRFEDPEVGTLRTIIENQRNEITQLLDEKKRDVTEETRPVRRAKPATVKRRR